ncbi:hypothetical protein [Methylobacterium segetis]|uniref:hypothetical protein n=1 Tax=Methylobacterium segetis TaxID=2488750 RepID=UPI0010442ABD|nr:hypothetical protein [Methylobacterium segetis]
MRCFVLLHALTGDPGGSPPEIYVNRDLITVATPVRLERGSAYAGANTLLSFNGNALRWVVETPAEVMKAPCLLGRGSAPD